MDNIQEPSLENLKGLGPSHLDGTFSFNFPEIVDNTMRCDYVACPQKFHNRHILRRVGNAESIHLVAGKAFAEANDVFRQTYHGGDKNYEYSLGQGLKALFGEYGYDAVREADPEWSNNAKSAVRVAQAYLEYWKEYKPGSSIGGEQHILDDGTVASELGFSLPLDVLHPVTGKPLVYHGRCDCMEYFMGGLWLVDDKTTGSLGASWMKQWDTRSQFMGYTYAYRQKGFDIVGTIARGVGILKTQITHAQVPVRFAPHVLERWWEQVNTNFQAAVDDWKAGKYGYNFSDACNSFGKCDYSDVCRSKLQYKELRMMPIRVWKPQAPEESLTYDPASF